MQSFVNTWEAERGLEALPDPESLRLWFRERGLLPDGSRVKEGDLARARRLREALRALLAANNGCGDGTGAFMTLNEVAERARLLARFVEGDGISLAPAAGGVDGALGEILAAVHAGMEAGTWGRLKACRNSGCVWAFYDRSRNRSGSWCSMDICGNRIKTRAYRRRRLDAG